MPDRATWVLATSIGCALRVRARSIAADNPNVESHQSRNGSQSPRLLQQKGASGKDWLLRLPRSHGCLRLSTRLAERCQLTPHRTEGNVVPPTNYCGTVNAIVPAPIFKSVRVHFKTQVTEDSVPASSQQGLARHFLPK